MSALSEILILFLISASKAQHLYRSIDPQKYFNYHINPYVSAEIKGDNSDVGNVALTFHGNIHKKDNFKVSVKYVNDRGSLISHVVKVTNLCDQLEIELQDDQSFKLGDMLGLSGIQCPILVSDINEKFETKPMKWYPQHNFSEKIECGVHTYYASLYKCDSNGNRCKTLLETGIKSLLTSKHCHEKEEFNEPSSLPIDLSSDIKVSQLSKTRLTNINAENVEVIDHSSNNETVGTINAVDVTDQKIGKVNLVDNKTRQKYDILNSQVNNVRVIDTKLTNYNKNNQLDDDDYNYDDDDYNDDDDDDDNKIHNHGPPQTRVTQVRTKGSSVTHLENIEDQVGDSEILETQEERDQTLDSESNNVAIETNNKNQRNKFSSNLGSIIMGNKIKSNVVLHSL